MEPDDKQLIEEYLFGNNNSALEKLIERHLSSIYNFVYRLVGGADEAQDITQEVFVKVWRNLDKYDPRREFKAWLFSIARHTTIDWFRKKKPLAFSRLNNDDENDFADTLADIAPLPDELFAQKELGERLEGALGQIHPEHRLIINLHLSDGLTFEEIATLVKKPMNTVKSQYRRGLLALRGFLAPK